MTALLLAAAIGALPWIASCEVRASPNPAPALAASDRMREDAASDGAGSEWFEVDWTYWASVNPDVIGWVSIPGTGVSQPIVQASAEDPDYYLDHDAYRRYNPMGCPYLDASCENGLESLNAVVCGHNWAGGRIFSDLARMSDAAYASEHATVLLQTPEERLRLEVQAVEVVNGDAPTKATSFASAAEFQAWWTQRWQASCVRLSKRASYQASDKDGIRATKEKEKPTFSETPTRILTLATCSYAHDNDRTLVYCAPSSEAELQATP